MPSGYGLWIPKEPRIGRWTRILQRRASVFQIVSTKPLLPESEQELRKSGTYLGWQEEGSPPAAWLMDALADADALLTHGARVDEALLRQAKHLRVVSTPSVGYDHFDIAAMRRHRVVGTHTPGVLDDTVADLAMALMLACARRIVELDGWVRTGRWTKSGTELFGVDVHHRTLGIIGMGRIGQVVAKRAHFGFDMNVLYHSRSRHPEIEQSVPATYLDFDELLQQSDFVVLLCPLTPQTIGLMNAAAFAKMKPSAIFINISRGKTVEEDALFRALESGQIRAAGLDVFVTEPTPVDNPLLKLPNVVAVPHIGSATQVTRDAMESLAVANLVAVLEGRYGQARIVPELRELVPDGDDTAG